MKKIIKHVTLYFIVSVMFPTVALASSCGFSYTGDGPTGLSDMLCPVLNAANILLLASGAVLVVLVLMGGLKYIMAQGDPKGIQGAHVTLTYAVYGFVVVVGLFVITSILSSLTGTDVDINSQIENFNQGAENFFGEIGY